MPSIASAISAAQAKGLDRLDAQWLLLHSLGARPPQWSEGRAWLLAHAEDDVPAAAESRFAHHLQRRISGEPLAYITGRAEFFGLDLQVDRRVLIPRPDTETLVIWALELLNGPISDRFDSPLAVLDLGTGSGAIALALKHERPQTRVHAIDASADALAVARANALERGLQVEFSQGSWLDSVQRQYHCIVANPPYVAEHDPHLAALAHEPQTALVSGPNGLQDLRHIICAGSAQLYPGAWLLVEHGFDQGEAVRSLFAAAAYEAIETRRDLGGRERCTGGRVPETILRGPVGTR